MATFCVNMECPSKEKKTTSRGRGAAGSKTSGAKKTTAKKTTAKKAATKKSTAKKTAAKKSTTKKLGRVISQHAKDAICGLLGMDTSKRAGLRSKRGPFSFESV